MQHYSMTMMVQSHDAPGLYSANNKNHRSTNHLLYCTLSMCLYVSMDPVNAMLYEHHSSCCNDHHSSHYCCYHYHSHSMFHLMMIRSMTVMLVAYVLLQHYVVQY